MNSKLKNCQYPILRNYFLDSEYMNAIAHIRHCNHCLNQIIDIDRNLLFANQDKINDHIIYNENELSIQIDRFKNNDNDLSISNKDSKIPKKIIEKMSHLIENMVSDEIVKTPVFLQKIIYNDLNNTESQGLQNIIIKISDGLKMVANYINNVIVIQNEMVPVSVRSGLSTKENSLQGSINFVQILEDNKAHYNIIKDGSESILLTVSFENEKSRPDFINLKSEEQLILSKRLNSSYAYFSKLKQGNYCIELNYQSKTDILSVPIMIV